MGEISQMHEIKGLRQGLQWGVLILGLCVLYMIKPAWQIQERTMYLPWITRYQPISPESVTVSPLNHPFLAVERSQSLGHMTITTPYQQQGDEAQALGTARRLAAQQGGNQVIVYSMGVMPWFDSKQYVFRLQAIVARD